MLPKLRYTRSLLCVLILLLTVHNALGQSAAATRTQCKQWDDTYLATFHAAFWLVLAGSLLFSLLLPALLGRLSWALTSARSRILLITFVILLASAFSVAIWPRAFGYGNFIFTGIDPRYVNCETTQFGAEGFFGGLIGKNVAAAAQWITMLILLLIASVVGGSAALVVSELATRVAGMRARVEGGAL